MKCSNCGVENSDEARFCKSCGEVLPSTEITLVSDQNIPGRYIIRKRFKILKKLGKGGMGEVLLAEDVKLKRKVAIKSILLKDNVGLTDTTSKLRFLREAQTASQLDHPNICTLYEIYEEGDRDYIVMQYIDGVTLDQIIGVKKLSVDKILDISIQACAGIMEAHANDIIHRDIKPGNIMVDKKGTVKILDFGLAKFSDDSYVKDNDRVDSNLTEKGFVMGTVSYISPEQARGKSLDRRTDIFSFGIMLYEMIEGQNPFKVDEQIETLYNVLNKEVEFTRDIPDELKRITVKALEKDIEKRYPDFAQLKQDLEAFQTLYQQEKEEKKQPVGAETEIINFEEQAKLLEEVQKTSDKEELGELVYRIKQFKASTERVSATSGKKKLNFKWVFLALAAAVIVVGALFLLLKPSPPPPPVEKFYIYLHPFEIDSKEQFLPEMLNYLLTEALNQFEEFKTINKDTALYIAGKENQDIDMKLLKSKFNIKYELSGKLEKAGKGYNIKALLKSTGKGSESYNIPAPGLNRDELLKTQVDVVVDSVYNRLSQNKTKKTDIKKVSKIFGKEWQKFSEFYAGLRFHKRWQFSNAEDYFNKSRDLLISKYYLSELYNLNSERNKALDIIKNEINSQIDKLTPWLRLKVNALKAHLNFKFDEEKENLDQLKKAFPFSKEVFYDLGEAYFHRADPEKAIENYKQALSLDKNYSNALNHLGYCYAYIGKHKDANAALQEYQRLDNTANSYDSLGDGYFYAGQLDFAESCKLNAAGQAEDVIAWPYQTLTDIYILKAQYTKADQALNDYQKLRTSPKNEAYVLAKRAFIAYKDRRYDEALQDINDSLNKYNSDDIKEDSAEANWLKGLILLALGKVDESKAQLKWLEKFKNRYLLDWNNFKAAYKYFIHLQALILEKENRKQEAEEYFKQLIANKTKLSYWITYYHYQFFHTEYARFLERNQKDQQALKELAECLKFNDGNYIPALWLKAEILEKQNKPEEARAVYEKIAELYGESTENNYYRDLLKKKLKST